MTNKKYSAKDNYTILHNILGLYYKGKYYEALNYVQEYNQNYPKDIKGKYVEAKLLRLTNNPTQAEKILKLYLPTIINNSELYAKYVFELIFTEIDLQNYYQALAYYQEYLNLECNETSDYDTSFLRTYLLAKLDYFKTHPDLSDYSFYEKQIIRYKKDECLKYNKKMIDQAEELIPCFTYFYPNIDLDALYLKIETFLPMAEEFKSYSLFKNYIFKMPNIGFDTQGNLNYIRITATEVDDDLRIVNIAPIRLNGPKTPINDLKTLELTRLIKNPTRILAKK